MRTSLLALAGFILLCYGAEAVAQKPSRARSATGGAAAVKSARSATSSGGGAPAKQQRAAQTSASTKKSGGSGNQTKSGKRGSGKEEDQGPPPLLVCAEEAADKLTGGECKFLLPEPVRATPFGEQSFLCALQTKASGKTTSVFEYFLQQGYGVSESRIKEGVGTLTIGYKNKGIGEYFSFVLERLNSGKLSDADIFDKLTEQILKDSDIDPKSQAVIENKEIAQVTISLPFTKNDIDRCRSAATEALGKCGANAASDPLLKTEIAKNCSDYESELIKHSANARADVMKRKGELETVLLKRLSGANENAARALELAKEATSLQEAKRQQGEQEQTNKIKDERAKLVRDTVGLDPAKPAFANKNKEICKLDNQLKQLDPYYAPADGLGCANAPPPAPEEKPRSGTGDNSGGGETGAGE